MKTNHPIIAEQCKTLLSILSMTAGPMLCLTAWPTLAETFSTDFNSGLPPHAAIYGNAFVDSSGGVGNSGALRLTRAQNDQIGSFIIEPLDGGAPLTGFNATFKLFIGNGDGADGFSFNFANDLPDDVIPEDGAGTGLTIAFDTYDNGNGEAPAIDVKYRGFTLASTKGIGPLFRAGQFVDVRLHVDPEGFLDLMVGTSPVYERLFIGFTPSPGRFGLGARTGASTDDHIVDDLTIETIRTFPTGPHLLSVTPLAQATRGDVNVALVVQDGTDTQLNPATVLLLWNGMKVSPALSRAGEITTIAYDPPGLLAPGSDNTFVLSFNDTGQPATSTSFTFHFMVANYLGPNGNFYEFVYAPGLSWPDAKVAAEQRTCCGRQGHLATITDADEDVYLEKLRQQSFWGEAWAGGFQQPGQLTLDQGWFWVHDEGPIAGVNGGAQFADWSPGEPNDYGTTTDIEDDEENFLNIGHNIELGWNDAGFAWVNGYVVEYEIPIIPIDVKPGDSSNLLNLGSNGKVDVAILSAASFDAATIDPATVRFGRSGTEAVPLSYSLADVNKDKRKDLVCQFDIAAAGFHCSDTVAWLQATPFGGCLMRGSDAITTQHCPPFGLALRALQDVRQQTDVYLTINGLEPGCAPPSLAQHLLLKSFDLFGKLRWTKNLQSLALAPSVPQASSAVVQFPDMVHFQNVAGQVEAKSCQGNATLVLRAESPVLFRPDLAITGIEAAPTVSARQIVNITASIAELNGDVGAKANLYLMEAGQTLDVAHSVALGPRGQAVVVFSTIFQQPGKHQLTVLIGDVQPGDYNDANNTGEFSLEVLPLPPTYCVFYQHMEHERWEVIDNPFFTAVNYQSGTFIDDFQLNLDFDFAFQFPIEHLRFGLFADGMQRNVYELIDILPTSTFSGGDCFFYETSRPVLEDGTSFYIQTHTCTAGNIQKSYVSLFRHAANYVFTSSFHDKYWGTTQENSGGQQMGQPFNAYSFIDAQVEVRDLNQDFQGAIHLPLFNNPINNEWNNPENHGYDHGVAINGNNCGVIK